VLIVIVAYGASMASYELKKPEQWDVKVILQKNEDEKTVYLFDDTGYEAFYSGMSLIKEGTSFA
jgi:hypothetical protein